MSCEYCRQDGCQEYLDEVGYGEMTASAKVIIPGEGSLAAAYGPYLRLEVGIFGVGFANRYQIRYCPMCGRKLGGDE